jgi:hypothetical protein
MAMAQSKLELYKIQLHESLSGLESSNDPVKIVGDPVAFQQAYNCNVASNPNDGITAAINQFFAGSSDSVKTGFKSLVSVGLQAFLGATSLGQTETVQTFITMEHNAIIRVDVKLWRYNFSDSGIIGTISNAMCYIFCKSVVDHTKVSLDTLTYLISAQTGDDLQAVQAYIAQLRAIWLALDGASPAAIQAEVATADKTRP